MGWVEQRGKKFRLSFRYGGKMFRHSLGVETQREADESLSLVERNLRLLEEGILDLPRGADLPLFLLTGGKLTAKPEVADVVTLGGLVTLYMGAHVGAQESNTIYTARIHAAHLKKTLGDDFAVQLLTTSDLQAHVERRAKAKGRGGKPLSPTTIKKEIASFSGIWSWAVRMGHLTGPFPNKGLIYPKTSEKPPFQTRAEIEEQLKRGGLEEDEKRELWNSLFLTLPEVAECLEHVRQIARHDWIYPMFCFAAHTGRGGRRFCGRGSPISTSRRRASSSAKRSGSRGGARRGGCPSRDSCLGDAGMVRRPPRRRLFDQPASQNLPQQENPGRLRACHHRREQLPLQRDHRGRASGKSSRAGTASGIHSRRTARPRASISG